MRDFASIIAAATEYRATRGARPLFKTPEAAAAYDQGYDAYPAEITDAIDSPAMRGWIQREVEGERRQTATDEMHADAAWCERNE